MEMEIVKNKARWEAYAYKCAKYYNVNNFIIYDNPEEYPCIAVSQLISDLNGSRIKFKFVYKKDCQRLLKAL